MRYLDRCTKHKNAIFIRTGILIFLRKQGILVSVRPWGLHPDEYLLRSKSMRVNVKPTYVSLCLLMHFWDLHGDGDKAAEWLER